MLARDDDHAFVIIVQVGIVFGDEFQALGGIDPLVQRTGHAHERHAEHLGGVGDRLRHLLRASGHAVKRPVRLDVEELYAFAFEKAFERPNLIDDAIGQFFGPHLHLAPAKSLQIRQGRMRANLDIMPFRQPHGTRHHRRVGGVKAAGDVGDGDMGHQAFIIADFVKAEALAHVAVDRELRVGSSRGHCSDLLLSPARPHPSAMKTWATS